MLIAVSHFERRLVDAACRDLTGQGFELFFHAAAKRA